MEKEEGIYLTIGELAQMSNVNTKSLRYYERIGVLVPAKINPETGYRYYLPEQLAHVTAIQFCIRAGIPLSRFALYDSKDQIEMGSMIDDAADNVRGRIASLQGQLADICAIAQTVERGERLLRGEGPLRYRKSARRYLTESLEEGLHADTINRKIQGIYERAAESGYETGLSFGELCCYRPAVGSAKRYAFVQVSGEGRPASGLLEFPETACTAVLCSRDQEKGLPWTVSEKLSRRAGIYYIFEMPLLTRRYCPEQPAFEWEFVHLEMGV